MNKIKLVKSKVINMKGSSILKYLQSSKNLKLKEIYFSEIKYGYQKGWNLHKKTHCNLSVVLGKIKVTIFKKSKKIHKSFIISRKNLSILVIPKNYWFKYESLSKPFSLLVNSISIKHSKKETKKIDCNKFKLPE